MEQLAAQGVRTLYIQPTHLICGEEYHALSQKVAEKAGLFERVVLGRPLLYDMDDCRRAAEALLEDFSPEEGEALVFIDVYKRQALRWAFFSMPPCWCRPSLWA